MKFPLLKWIVASLVLSCLAFADAEAGKIRIVGHGEASAAPEVATFQVFVNSICYDTSVQAKEANAVLANQLVTSLKAYLRGPEDKVIARGGVNMRETETVPDSSGHSRVLCELKWRATNTIVLKTSALTDLAEIQDGILKAIDQQAINSSVAAQTYAELGQPDFDVLSATQNRLRGEAQNQAWLNAKTQLDGFGRACSFQNLRLTNIEQPSYQVIPYAKGYAVPGGSENIETPIIPDQIKETADWAFTWTFDPSTNCKFE